MNQKHDEHPYYGVNIFRHEEQTYINNLLNKYKNSEATDALKKRIYDDLQREKYLGNIKIPFKVVLRQDPSGTFPSYIEVILDTKV